jgi:beta-phosphoglucomutase-like phosphatase (HAD superfamily)
VVVGDDVANGKPHPEPYLLAARRLGVDPARCLAIEDSPTGVASALAAGCTVLAVPNHVPLDALDDGREKLTVRRTLEGLSHGALAGIVAALG